MTIGKDLFLSLLVVILFGIIFLQKCQKDPEGKAPSSDTVIIYDTTVIHDTVKGDIVYISSEPDIIWITDDNYKPDTNYNKLLKQYKQLGDDHFILNTVETTFSLGQYGSVKVIDKIKANRLIDNKMISDLKIPKETITVTKYPEPTRKVYAGLEVFGNPKSLITGAQANVLYQDKKDRIFGAGVGWNGDIQYSVSTYWKIKLNNK